MLFYFREQFTKIKYIAKGKKNDIHFPVSDSRHREVFFVQVFIYLSGRHHSINGARFAKFKLYSGLSHFDNHMTKSVYQITHYNKITRISVIAKFIYCSGFIIEANLVK